VKFLLPLSVLVRVGERFRWREAPAAVQPAVSFVMEDVLTPAEVLVPAACLRRQIRLRSTHSCSDARRLVITQRHQHDAAAGQGNREAKGLLRRRTIARQSTLCARPGRR
jgi:hypothetical protein